MERLERWEEAVIEVVEFTESDIITTSPSTCNETEIG